MDAAPTIASYDWGGGREAMLRLGPTTAPMVIVAPPLFEEANRTRALIVLTLRLLAARGIGGALPDLPGQGESERDLTGVRLATWRAAFTAAAASVGEGAMILAIRSGALYDGEAAASGRLHLSPVAGRTLVRDLLRARRVAAVAAGNAPPADDLDTPGSALLLAGNLIERPLLRDLMAAAPSRPDRTLTLFPDPTAADRVLSPPAISEGSADRPRFRPPWSASEPFADPALAKMLADEIAGWIASCAG